MNVIEHIEKVDSILINDDKYEKIGKESDGIITKYILIRDDVKYWLEFSEKVVLWKETDLILDRPIPEELWVEDKKFDLVDFGLSEIDSEGDTGYDDIEVIEWWDFKFENKMISIGWLTIAKRWENLIGDILSIDQIKFV